MVVDQRVESVELGKSAADSTVTLAEGAAVQLQGRALDSRGHVVKGMTPLWQVDDSSVAGVATDGMLSAHNAGRTLITATIAGVSRRVPVAVVTTASAINLVAGAEQRAFAGNALPQSIVVRATNRHGAPSPGQTVTFKPASGQGVVEPATVTTDADGRARTAWTLADYPGRQTLLASVDKVDSAVAVVAEADPIANNTRVTALVDNLIGRAGAPLVDSLAVRVTDSTGRALPVVPVRWTAVDGGIVNASAPRTDSLGVAYAHWTLAMRTGSQRLRAQVGGGSGGRTIPPVTMNAKALAGAPAAVAVVSGDEQHGHVASLLGKPVVARVSDANGSGVAGAAVTLSPSGGTLADSSLHSDSLGMVRTRWTMGRTAGDYTLAVHVDGVKKLVKLIAHAAAAAPANLSFDDAPLIVRDKHSKQHAKGTHLLALVTDVYGNPVPDARVNFAVKSGSVSPARSVSDATGRAAIVWTIGTKPGEQTLTGVVRGTDVKGTYVADGSTHEPSKKVSAKTTAAKKSGR